MIYYENIQIVILSCGTSIYGFEGFMEDCMPKEEGIWLQVREL